MNIEQNLDMQELSEEHYTKVYDGQGCGYLIAMDVVDALPEVPVPPDGQSIDI